MATKTGVQGWIAGLKKEEVLGTTMAYHEAGAVRGSGPLVLFLHGNPSSSYVWRNVIDTVVAHAPKVCVCAWGALRVRGRAGARRGRGRAAGLDTRSLALDAAACRFFGAPLGRGHYLLALLSCCARAPPGALRARRRPPPRPRDMCLTLMCATCVLCVPCGCVLCAGARVMCVMCDVCLARAAPSR